MKARLSIRVDPKEPDQFHERILKSGRGSAGKALACLALILFCGPGGFELKAERVYGIAPVIHLRSAPGTKSRKIGCLRHTRWVQVLRKETDWLKIITSNGVKGYIARRLVSQSWLKVHKKERKLYLMKDRSVIKTYPVALGFNPLSDKIKQGDGATPEGRFYICEVIKKPRPQDTYGPVSLRISYPGLDDARRGLQNKMISKTQYLAIVRAVHRGIMPPQNTGLGGSIKIHGGINGVSSDWTLGCIALKNRDLQDIFQKIPKKRCMVEIYHGREQEELYHSSGYMNKRILGEAKKMLLKPCRYTKDAAAIIPVSFPMGDFDQSIGVCTDVVIRALRGLNIDLQALLYEDILLNPGRYKKISQPDNNIDHRRTRNLKVYFDHNAVKLTNKRPEKEPEAWQAGDIVLLDTGIQNGTIYDHIGIVSSSRTGTRPLVINLWTVGCQLNEMDLLNGEYPKIVGHYRLHGHLFYSTMDIR